MNHNERIGRALEELKDIRRRVDGLIETLEQELGTAQVPEQPEEADVADVADVAIIVSKPTVEAALPASKPVPAPVPSVRLVATQAYPANWPNVLRELLPVLRAERNPDEEIRFIETLVRDERKLSHLPGRVQVSILTWAAARLRSLQETHAIPDQRIPMPTISGYAKRTQVGFVRGPNRDHRPNGRSWEADAVGVLIELDRELEEVGVTKPNPEKLILALKEVIADAAPFEEIQPHILAALDGGVKPEDPRLVKLAAPFLESLKKLGKFRKLREAIRAAGIPEEVVDVPSSPLPPDWPWFAATRGKRAIILGGDARELNRKKIEAVFGFARLEWMPTEFSPNSLRQVADRVSNGGVNFLIILRRFVGHDADNILIPACREKGIPWVSIPSGYGIQGIRLEIEKMIKVS